jgi:hypothetical protein
MDHTSNINDLNLVECVYRQILFLAHRYGEERELKMEN